jgi:MSHA pilin protein MshC
MCLNNGKTIIRIPMIVVNIRHNSGFSLIELITVMILLGILGVVALGRFSGGDAFAARGFFDDTVNAVRFAQKYAISSGCRVRVVTTAGGYQLRQSSTCTAGDFNSMVVNPANRANSYQNTDIPSGYTLTAGTITFTAQGLREEASSNFDLSSGATTYRFRVHASTGLTEVL